MVERVPLSPRELIRHLPDLLSGQEPGLDNPRVTDFLIEHPTARLAVSAASCMSQAFREGMSTRGVDRPTRLSVETLAGSLKREMALLSFRAGVAELEVHAKKNGIPYRGFAEKTDPDGPNRPPDKAEVAALLEMMEPASTAEPLTKWAEETEDSASLTRARTLLAHAQNEMTTPTLDWYSAHVSGTLSPSEAPRIWGGLAKIAPAGENRGRALGELALVLETTQDTQRAVQAHVAATANHPTKDVIWFNAMLGQTLIGDDRQAIRCADHFMASLVHSPAVIEHFDELLRSNAQALRTAMASSPSLRQALPRALDARFRSTLSEISG